MRDGEWFILRGGILSRAQSKRKKNRPHFFFVWFLLWISEAQHVAQWNTCKYFFLRLSTGRWKQKDLVVLKCIKIIQYFTTLKIFEAVFPKRLLRLERKFLPFWKFHHNKEIQRYKNQNRIKNQPWNILLLLIHIYLILLQ